MSDTDEVSIPLKIMVDKGRNKVLFVESDYSFVDILFSFMTLPIGTIARLIEKSSSSELPSVGCLSTLYNGLANLPSRLFSTEDVKQMLLHTRNSSDHHCSKLKLNIDDTKYFVCENWSCSRGSSASCRTYNTAKCSCGRFFIREIGLDAPDVNTDHNDRGVFVTEAATFLVTADLCVMPNLLSSNIQMLSDQGITDMSLLEERDVNIGIQELALVSQSPLTDLLLCEMPVQHLSELGNFAHPVISEDLRAISTTMKVTLFLQKSNGKPIFIQAGNEFINFIFSFLAIPLGTVLFLLNGKTSMGSIDNLYQSILNLNAGPYLISQDRKDMLLHPEVAQRHICENNILSLKEGNNPKFYCYSRRISRKHYGDGYLTLSRGENGFGKVWSEVIFKGSMLSAGYVRESAMFMMTDDLNVTPVSTISTMSLLDKLSIPLSDLEEREVSIGIEEGLSILKASLSSSSAISNGLDLFLNKLEQEK